MASEPYYSGGGVTLYCGRMEDVLPGLGQFDAIVTDPPYGETSLSWDRWPDGWPALAAAHTSSMWCFGSMRMWMERRDEFTQRYLRDERGRFRAPGLGDWRLAQDVVWEKGASSQLVTDRFRRNHEHVLHWYHGPWGSLRHVTPRIAATPEEIAINGSVARNRHPPAHLGDMRVPSLWTESGTRLMKTVIHTKSMRGRSIHPTEKPINLLAPLIEYSVPEAGVVLDPFAGSCSTLLTARQIGRRAMGIEVDEAMCERAANRLSTPDLFMEVSGA